MKNRLVLIPIVLLVGCTSIRVSRTETGLFDNDPAKLNGACEAIEQKMANQEVLTRSDLEKMGFDFKAPNVEAIPGPVALKRIFGPTVFREWENKESTDSTFKEFGHYRGFFIPYHKIKTVSDRIYFSHKETFRKGDYMRVFVLFKEDVLCYHEVYKVRLNTYQSHYAFAEAILFVIKGPGKTALGLLETVNEYQRPGLEFVAPIPIP